MEKEIWKDIVGYEGLYQISNFGNIRSKKLNKQGRLLSPFISNSGYYAIVLDIKKRDFKLNYIHRLVATAFITNINNLEQVNHIDGNKLNNNVSNLEWCSRSDNIKHAIKKGLITKESVNERITKMNKKVIKSVLQIKDGKIIAKYESVTVAGNQFSKNAKTNIGACARGIIPSAYGFQWRYN